jgi:hypothetical protein
MDDNEDSIQPAVLRLTNHVSEEGEAFLVLTVTTPSKQPKGVYVNEFVVVAVLATKLLSILMLVTLLRRRCIIL